MAACCLCDTARGRRLLCPDCFAASCAGRRSDQHSLAQQRDAALQRLETVVEDKETYHRQQLQLLHISQEVRRMQVRAGEAERQLGAVRQRTQAARHDLQHRQLRLREAQQHLAQLSRQMQATLPQQREAQSQACMRSLEVLVREQRTKVVRRAMQVLPLTLVPPVRPASPAGAGPAASGSSGSAAGAAGATATAAAASQTGQAGEERAAAMVCSLLLPDSRASMSELAEQGRQLGSALGYLALLLDLLCRFLQLPVPHRCAFQGSTTRLWQPDSFFDMRATPPNDALLLGWPKADTLSGGGSGSGNGGSRGVPGQPASRQEQQVQAALHAVQRSVGMLVYARLGPEAALKVPPSWSPFTWLAGVCKMLAAEPRLSSNRMAVPTAAAAAASRPLAASAVFGRYSPEHGGMACSVLFQDGSSDEMEEDWEHLPRPAYGMIPPPPSQGFAKQDVGFAKQHVYGSGHLQQTPSY